MYGVCDALLLVALGAAPIPPEPGQAVYTLPVRVDEVNVVFSASDFNGRPINDLELSDMRLLENGKRQKKILKFEHRTDLPLRAGIVVDTSGSMIYSLPRNQQITGIFAEKILRSASDQSFIMGFDFEAKLLQDWTAKSKELREASLQLGKDAGSRLGGTALYDSVYLAVRDQFANKNANSIATANVLLVFSDGEDNKSHARLQDVVDICQQTNSRIYVFYGSSKSIFGEGQKNLRDLATGTGGRVFYDDDAAHALNDLRIIENDLRNNYLIVYKPSNIKDDGRFHAISLTSPTRGGVITTRSGYYASREGK
jgi:VWFA-related protein